MTYATILTETRDRVRYVTLNRPEKRNALSLELQKRADRRPRGGGAGSRGGLHRDSRRRPGLLRRLRHHAPQDRTPGGTKPIRTDINDMRGTTRRLARIWELSKPVIAQIHGYCVAGGTDLAMHCDMIIAADDTQIGFPPVRAQGAPPTHMWTYMVGPQWAKRIAAHRRLHRRRHRRANRARAERRCPADQLADEVHPPRLAGRDDSQRPARGEQGDHQQGDRADGSHDAARGGARDGRDRAQGRRRGGVLADRTRAGAPGCPLLARTTGSRSRPRLKRGGHDAIRLCTAQPLGASRIPRTCWTSPREPRRRGSPRSGWRTTSSTPATSAGGWD